MSESDAEWIDTEPKPEVAGPNKPPPPPPRTTTFRPFRPTRPIDGKPRRPFPPNGRRPRFPGGRRLPPGDPRINSPDKASNSAVTISISVVSALLLIALLVLLIYMLVLKKKFRKVKKMEKQPQSSQYSLRVEDIAHIDINEDSSHYVNTADLQKLVSTIRMKDKKPPPPIPLDEDFPDVVRILKPPATLPGNNMYDYDSQDGSSTPEIYSNVSSPIYPIRPAPAVPPSIARTNWGSKDNIFTKESSLPPQGNSSSPKTLPKPAPPTLPKPSQAKPDSVVTSISSSQNTSSTTKQRSLVKPQHPPPPTPSSKSNQSQKKTQQMKPLLPPLKMNLVPGENRQDSGFSTPDTAVSYMGEQDNPIPKNPMSSDSITLSVKARKAMLEDMFASEGVHRPN